MKCVPEKGSGLFEFDESIKKVWVDVGPHQTPIIPKEDDTGLILVEPNFHVYRELFDKFNVTKEDSRAFAISNFFEQ